MVTKMNLCYRRHLTKCLGTYWPMWYVRKFWRDWLHSSCSFGHLTTLARSERKKGAYFILESGCKSHRFLFKMPRLHHVLFLIPTSSFTYTLFVKIPTFFAGHIQRGPNRIRHRHIQETVNRRPESQPGRGVPKPGLRGAHRNPGHTGPVQLRNRRQVQPADNPRPVHPGPVHLPRGGGVPDHGGLGLLHRLLLRLHLDVDHRLRGLRASPAALHDRLHRVPGVRAGVDVHVHQRRAGQAEQHLQGRLGQNRGDDRADGERGGRQHQHLTAGPRGDSGRPHDWIENGANSRNSECQFVRARVSSRRRGKFQIYRYAAICRYTGRVRVAKTFVFYNDSLRWFWKAG